MQTMTKNLIFLGGVFLVLGTLTVASLTGTKRPRVPRDANHPRPVVEATCRDCHAPGKRSPQSPKHPPKDQCLTCHRVR